jgi:uncharacterized surface protein with fasciclin (FAS1) repeats
MNATPINAARAAAAPAGLPVVNLADTAAAQGTLNTFSRAVVAAGLTGFFKSAGPYTVFAPTDDAFDRLPVGKLDEWMKPENKSQLISMLKQHVTPGRVSGEDVGKLNQAKTVSGQIVVLKTTGDKVTIEDAGLTTLDIASSNGVIHIIDQVLTPPSRH